jgi:hypothetical protein
MKTWYRPPRVDRYEEYTYVPLLFSNQLTKLLHFKKGSDPPRNFRGGSDPFLKKIIKKENHLKEF